MKKSILITLLVILTSASYAQTTNSIPKPNIPMKYDDVYPVFVTKNLNASKEFYVTWFNFQVAFESGFFILLIAQGEKSFTIAFLDEEHPSSPPSSPAMNAQAGVFLTLQVANARADYERLLKSDIKINYPITDEPWGQRRFGIIDPNGMYVDVVEQITPQEGFWDKYPAKK
jgi:catechol 2,3-dioxygenase-like lactoylglutathione lyase family enzyme